MLHFILSLPLIMCLKLHHPKNTVCHVNHCHIDPKVEKNLRSYLRLAVLIVAVLIQKRAHKNDDIITLESLNQAWPKLSVSEIINGTRISKFPDIKGGHLKY